MSHPPWKAGLFCHDVAAPLSNDLVTDLFQGTDRLTSRHHWEFGAHTVTATLLIRVLDMSGIG
jgi:hypothetical protein